MLTREDRQGTALSQSNFRIPPPRQGSLTPAEPGKRQKPKAVKAAARRRGRRPSLVEVEPLFATYGAAKTVVMQEMGHTDPALALAIYAHAMRRDEGENERLRALVEGVEMPGLVTSDHSEGVEIENASSISEVASRS
jgi:hypothetical protein